MRFDHKSGEHLAVDGANIYYEISGDEHAPTLLFLHGGFGNMEDFNHVIADLEKTFRIIGIDSRGQGRSTLGGQVLTYERLQNDVLRVLDHLNVVATSIVGFSDGGIVAYRLAALTSLHIEKLITIGSRWRFKDVEARRELLTGVTSEGWKQKFPDTYEMYQRLNPEPDFDRLTESLVGMWIDPDASGYPNEAIAKISCPLLIVRGDADHLIPKETVFELSKTVPGANLLNIPFAGHAAFQEQQAVFMTCANQFLQQ